MIANSSASEDVSLLVTCHPNAKSLCGHISERVIEALRARDANVVVNDLYGAGFNPTPSAQEFASYFDNEIPEDIRGFVTSPFGSRIDIRLADLDVYDACYPEGIFRSGLASARRIQL
jgi:hypothetical protein